jgi:hypothetical protein
MYVHTALWMGDARKIWCAAAMLAADTHVNYVWGGSLVIPPGHVSQMSPCTCQSGRMSVCESVIQALPFI